MKWSVLLFLVFEFVNCKKCQVMLQKCHYIKNANSKLTSNIRKLLKGERAYVPVQYNWFRNYNKNRRFFCVRTTPRDEFYKIEKDGLHSSAAPPYLIKFENGNDILSYTNEIDDDCFVQIKNLAKLPIVKGHVTILPDVHLGKGIIIGSVFLTEHFIIPNGVGVDIGCGVLCAQIRNLKKRDLKDYIINNIYNKIKKRVPLSFDFHEKEIYNSKAFFSNLINQYGSTNIKNLIQERHFKQLGSLGGGNHFIEIVYDASDKSKGRVQNKNTTDDDIQNTDTEKKKRDGYEESDIYILIHSGSRNLGKTVAEYYDALASKESNMKRNDLAYLNLQNPNGKDYLMDMKVCLEYAKQNRIYMMKIIETIIYEEVKCTLDWKNAINIHHNFCNFEKVTFFDKNENKVKSKYMYVTRKGSTSSKKGELGIIPGNMKVGSYIVKGKGNTLSYNSCSHGCGRLLSRTKAKQLINQSDFVNSMKGIKCDTNKKIRDEAPQAYKNLDQVLKNQETLIDIVKRLLPIINIKGF